jgi:mono/diheme cytochrome c family protein
MTMRPALRHSVLRLTAIALSLGAAPACSQAVPAAPSYQIDVRPIFLAHCTRCHGDGIADGGSLNNAHEPTGPYDAAAPLKSDPLDLKFEPLYLTQYADSGNCTRLDGGAWDPSCHFGALTAATSPPAPLPNFNLSKRLHGTLGGGTTMPPAPAAMLDDWELRVVDAWIANPICPDARNPDVALCPAGVGP